MSKIFRPTSVFTTIGTASRYFSYWYCWPHIFCILVRQEVCLLVKLATKTIANDMLHSAVYLQFLWPWLIVTWPVRYRGFWLVDITVVATQEPCEQLLKILLAFIVIILLWTSNIFGTQIPGGSPSIFSFTFIL